MGRDDEICLLLTKHYGIPVGVLHLHYDATLTTKNLGRKFSMLCHAIISTFGIWKTAIWKGLIGCTFAATVLIPLLTTSTTDGWLRAYLFTPVRVRRNQKNIPSDEDLEWHGMIMDFAADNMLPLLVELS